MTTIDKIESEFQSIKDKISPDDKIQAANTLAAHPGTIERYLRGDIRREPFALELLAFLKERISEREKILEN